jgi:plasmid stabilization system protein ParE
MKRTVWFHEAAEAELNEAADFYDMESPGLGQTFIDEVRHGVERIAELPEAAPAIRGRVRKRLLLKFPYSLLYSVHDDLIRLLAVAHHKRRPFYWRSRR